MNIVISDIRKHSISISKLRLLSVKLNEFLKLYYEMEDASTIIIHINYNITECNHILMKYRPKPDRSAFGPVPNDGVLPDRRVH